jgi:hypothetical protein
VVAAESTARGCCVQEAILCGMVYAAESGEDAEGMYDLCKSYAWGRTRKLIAVVERWRRRARLCNVDSRVCGAEMLVF